MWLWHIPTFYDAALRHPTSMSLEHLTFAVAGLLYWWHLLSPIRTRMRLGGMGPVLYMGSTKLLVGLLGTCWPSRRNCSTRATARPASAGG